MYDRSMLDNTQIEQIQIQIGSMPYGAGLPMFDKSTESYSEFLVNYLTALHVRLSEIAILQQNEKDDIEKYRKAFSGLATFLKVLDDA